MLAITRDIWGGTDYLPSVWHSWLRDAAGYLMVAERDGRVVGLHHIALHDESTAWMEGMRVAEEARGTRVAGALLDRGLEWAREAGCTVARLSTASINPASGRVPERAGMRVVETFLPLSAHLETAPDLPSGPRVARAMDAERVFHHLNDPEAGLPSGFYTEGWTAHPASRERVRLLCATNSVAISELGDTVRGVLIATCAYPFRHARIGALTGDVEAVGDLARFALHQAYRMGVRSVRATLSVSGRRRAAVESVGFQAAPDMVMLLHEMELDSA